MKEVTEEMKRTKLRRTVSVLLTLFLLFPAWWSAPVTAEDPPDGPPGGPPPALGGPDKAAIYIGNDGEDNVRITDIEYGDGGGTSL
jgi:hypothetical protein